MSLNKRTSPALSESESKSKRRKTDAETDVLSDSDDTPAVSSRRAKKHKASVTDHKSRSAPTLKTASEHSSRFTQAVSRYTRTKTSGPRSRSIEDTTSFEEELKEDKKTLREAYLAIMNNTEELKKDPTWWKQQFIASAKELTMALVDTLGKNKADSETEPDACVSYNGTFYPLKDQHIFTIGRDQHNDIVLDQDNTNLSRVHLMIIQLPDSSNRMLLDIGSLMGFSLVKRGDSKKQLVSTVAPQDDPRRNLDGDALSEFDIANVAVLGWTEFAQIHLNGDEDDRDVKIVGTCRVCLEAPRKIALKPCNHYALCDDCAIKVQTCPICRAAIVKRQPCSGSMTRVG